VSIGTDAIQDLLASDAQGRPVNESFIGKSYYERYLVMNTWTREAIDAVISLGIPEDRTTLCIDMFYCLSLRVDAYPVHRVRLGQHVVTRTWEEKWIERVSVIDGFFDACFKLDKIEYNQVGFDRVREHLYRFLGQRWITNGERPFHPITVEAHPDPGCRARLLVKITAFGIDTVPGVEGASLSMSAEHTL